MGKKSPLQHFLDESTLPYSNAVTFLNQYAWMQSSAILILQFTSITCAICLSCWLGHRILSKFNSVSFFFITFIYFQISLPHNWLTYLSIYFSPSLNCPLNILTALSYLSSCFLSYQAILLSYFFLILSLCLLQLFVFFFPSLLSFPLKHSGSNDIHQNLPKVPISSMKCS